MSSATRSAATTTPTARTTRCPGSTGSSMPSEQDVSRIHRRADRLAPRAIRCSAAGASCRARRHDRRGSEGDHLAQPRRARDDRGRMGQAFARCLGLYLAGAAIERRDRRGRSVKDNNFLLLFNAHHEPIPFQLAAPPRGQSLVDGARHRGAARPSRSGASSRPHPTRCRDARSRSCVRPRTDETARHDMPFGAQVLPGGEVRFRLWAPAAQARRALVLESAAGKVRALPLEKARRTAGSSSSPARRRRAAATAIRSTVRRWCPIRRRGAIPRMSTARARWSTRRPSSGRTTDWRGRPWHEAVIYELHVGTFSAGGHLRGRRRAGSSICRARA